MDILAFLKGSMDVVDVRTILILGVVATACMMVMQWAFQRLGLVHGSMTRRIGAFVLPAAARNNITEDITQLVIGVILTIAYAFVFHFINPTTIAAFAECGALIGFVHGFFVSFFSMFEAAAESTEEEEMDERAAVSVKGAVLNVVAQLCFGALVGAGYGFAELSEQFWQYISYVIVVALAVSAFLMVIVPRGPTLKQSQI